MSQENLELKVKLKNREEENLALKVQLNLKEEEIKQRRMEVAQTFELERKLTAALEELDRHHERRENHDGFLEAKQSLEQEFNEVLDEKKSLEQTITELKIVIEDLNNQIQMINDAKEKTESLLEENVNEKDLIRRKCSLEVRELKEECRKIKTQETVLCKKVEELDVSNRELKQTISTLMKR
jgi:chromosome segregation ATPase